MFHQTIIVGNVSWIGEMKTTSTGQNVLSFQVAVDTSYKNKDGEKVDQAEFYTVSVWNGQAENFLKWKNVGDPVLVSGQMKFDENRSDDGKLLGYWPKLTFPRIKYLPGGKRNGTTVENHDPRAEEPVEVEETDDIPF
jgi:single-strand DNA-binding protein